MNKYKHLSDEARKLRSKIKMCLSKRSYETKEEAYQKGQEIYKCKHCGKWHRSGQLSRFMYHLRKGHYRFG